MSARIRQHIRSNVVGYVAVFIALSGTAYAVDGPLPGQNQVGSEDIINGEVKNADLSIGASSSNTIADGEIQGVDVKNNTLTGTQIDESSLGAVLSADQATNAANAANADTANTAVIAFNADSLDGQDSSQFAPATAEGWHEIGAPGEPDFAGADQDPARAQDRFNGRLGCQWSNFDSVHNSAAFFKDPWGVVHLKGLVKAEDVADGICTPGSFGDATVFILPAAYRPARKEVQATLSGNDEIGRVGVLASGAVRIKPNADAFTKAKSYLSLNGITFRAAG